MNSDFYQEMMQVFRDRMAFAKTKRDNPDLKPSAWEDIEYDAYWDGEEKCAHQLMNDFNRMFKKYTEGDDK